MLLLKKDLLHKIAGYCNKAHPIEACGVISESSISKDCIPKIYSEPQQDIYYMQNTAKSPRYFSFDSKEQLQVWKDIKEKGAKVHSIFHSHTDGHPFPSAEDRLFMNLPNVHYLIVSTGSNNILRSYRSNGTSLVEEAIRYI